MTSRSREDTPTAAIGDRVTVYFRVWQGYTKVVGEVRVNDEHGLAIRTGSALHCIPWDTIYKVTPDAA